MRGQAMPGLPGADGGLLPKMTGSGWVKNLQNKFVVQNKFGAKNKFTSVQSGVGMFVSRLTLVVNRLTLECECY
jgi:hypothetical protein